MSKDLNDQIMRLPCKPDTGWPGGEQHAYKLGHREAHHAAAELALTTPPVLAAPANSAVLPELPDHPEPQVMKWSELEKKAIRAYGQACAAAERKAAIWICETRIDPTRPNTTSAYAMWHADEIRNRT